MTDCFDSKEMDKAISVIESIQAIAVRNTIADLLSKKGIEKTELIGLVQAYHDESFGTTPSKATIGNALDYMLDKNMIRYVITDDESNPCVYLAKHDTAAQNGHDYEERRA